MHAVKPATWAPESPHCFIAAADTIFGELPTCEPADILTTTTYRCLKLLEIGRAFE